jgi:hypothetical protein
LEGKKDAVLDEHVYESYMVEKLLTAQKTLRTPEFVKKFFPH